MEDSQEEKQNYLRENILNQGYDTIQFVNFLKSKKGEEGADVANWTMEDLKKVVQEFIESLNYKDDDNQETDQVQNENKEQIPPKRKSQEISVLQTPYTSKSSSDKLNTSNNSDNFGQKDEDYGIEIPESANCQRLEPGELGKFSDLEIKINSYKKVDGGFLSKSYFSFLIVTNPLDLKAYRRYSDFEWLKERLSVIYNTSILPRLSKKGKTVEERRINRRMRDLEKFLNFLLKDPLIKNSKILFDFLTIQNDDEFHKTKKYYDKMKTFNEVKEIKSLSGKVTVHVNKKKEKYLNYIKDNATFNEFVLKKLDDNFKTLKYDFDTIINRVNSFSPIFEQLIKISSKFVDGNATVEAYKKIKHIFESWRDVLRRQNSFFYIDLKEYFKFLGGNYRHIKDLVQAVENQKSIYYKYSKSLVCKKIELFKKQETSTWQLDTSDRNNLVTFYNNREIAYKKICFKETNHAIELKEKYGYYLNRMISEYERMRNINANENKAKTIFYAQKQQKIMNDYSNLMEEVVGVMEGCSVEGYAENAYMKEVNQDIVFNANDLNNQPKEEVRRENDDDSD